MEMVKNKSDKKMQYAYAACIAVILIFIVSSIVVCRMGHLEALRPLYIRDVSIDIIGMILCDLLLFSLAVDWPWSKQNNALFRLIFILALLFHFDLGSSFMEGNPENSIGILLANTLLFFNETLLIYSFWVYLREELKISKKDIPVINLICKSMVICELILDVLNLFTGFMFSVSPAGEYVEGRFQDLTEITTAVIYLMVWYVIISTKGHSIREKILLVTFLIFPVFSHIGGVITENYALVYPMYLFSVMLIYINVFLGKNRRILEQQVELDRQSTALMISQIQPHFLYNVLTTISNLCATDPEEAEETTVLFSQYLRTNLDSLRKTEPVPFGAELGHIRTYVELEKKRFGEKLNIEIDCPETGFLVPSLGIQPIVENSIKHGIRGKDSPGHLKISNRRTDKGYEVVIEDDGVGFDMSAPAKDDGRSHVGMINVRSRLEKMCDASMEVVSSPGNGCKTTIIFPLEGN